MFGSPIHRARRFLRPWSLVSASICDLISTTSSNLSLASIHRAGNRLTQTSIMPRNNRNYNNQRNNYNPRRRQRPPSSSSSGMQGNNSNNDNCYRQRISPGADVWVVKKEHQSSGQETRGTVTRLLTNSGYHPRGIKVMLTSGIVGRVTSIIDPSTPPSNSTAIGEEQSSMGNTSSFEIRSTGYVQNPSILLSSSLRNEASSTVIVDDEKLASLIEMDFDPETAAKALIRHNNNIDNALNELINSTS